MTQGARRLIFVMLTIVLITSSCRGDAINSDPTVSTITPDQGTSVTSTLPETMVTSDPQEAVPLAPNPASIDITLEEGSATTATIGPEGGSITSIGVNGIEYNLTIPEGALFSPEEITMTPIGSAEGKAIGDTFVAGVALQPEGLYFLKLVTIEMAGGMVDDSAVAFAAESGGRDFHLTPSKQADGLITISTTHFSEVGVSLEELADLFDTILPLAALAQLENALAFGNDQQALAAIERMINFLQVADPIVSFEQWNSRTAQIVSLTQRVDEVANDFSWNANSPGYTDVVIKFQNLVGQWHQQSDRLMQEYANKCIQGEIENANKVSLITQVGYFFNYNFGWIWREDFTNWSDVESTCKSVGVSYQANVVTTGTDFFSDISIGIEDQCLGSSCSYDPLELEVEYIDGFWLDTCVPTSGTAKLKLDIFWEGLNLGNDNLDYINSITVYVSIIDPVYIDCSPAGFELTADAQYPFHGGALEQVNQHRVNGDGRWEFELEYDPGGGVVAQFEEGPEKMTFPDGEYELWQLISLYQNTPAN